MSEQVPDSDPPRQRWYQFRIRDWLLLAVILSWLFATPWHINAIAGPTINEDLKWPILALAAFIGWKVLVLLPQRQNPYDD